MRSTDKWPQQSVPDNLTIALVDYGLRQPAARKEIELRKFRFGSTILLLATRWDYSPWVRNPQPAVHKDASSPLLKGTKILLYSIYCALVCTGCCYKITH